MSFIPVENEGRDSETCPFVTIYEKSIDGLVFRYAKYKNEAYIVLKDAYGQSRTVANASNSARQFHQRFKSRFPASFRKFKAMTRGGPQEMIFGTLDVINILFSRSKNIEVAVDHITKLTQFQKWFYATQAKEQALLEAKLQGDYNFLSSEVKFLHKERSIDRRNITALAQAVKQLQTQMDADIDRYQVKEIYDLVQTKLAVVVTEKRGLARPTSAIYRECWNNFNNHFKIARYRDLPATQFEDAKEYLLYQIEIISKELE